jgi:hypothetical protein
MDQPIQSALTNDPGAKRVVIAYATDSLFQTPTRTTGNPFDETSLGGQVYTMLLPASNTAIGEVSFPDPSFHAIDNTKAIYFKRYALRLVN